MSGWVFFGEKAETDWQVCGTGDTLVMGYGKPYLHPVSVGNFIFCLSVSLQECGVEAEKGW